MHHHTSTSITTPEHAQPHQRMHHHTSICITTCTKQKAIPPAKNESTKAFVFNIANVEESLYPKQDPLVSIILN
jgi:hypothetical protein